MSEHRTPRWPQALFWAGLAATITGLGVWQTLAFNTLWMWWRSGGWIYTLFAAVIVAASLILVTDDYRTPYPGWLVATSVMAGGAAVLASIGVGLFQGWRADAGLFLASVTITQDATLPEYDTRAPFTVAENQTASHMTLNGVLAETTYIPTTAHFATLVADKGVFQGYREIVWQQVSDSGQSVAGNCRFAAGGRRFNGPFWSNLQRAIIRRAGPELITQSDAYGVCVDGQAKIIVPLKTYRGLVYTYQVPDGVAVVDSDWNITIDRDVTPGEYPGPVYPMSLAVKQRESTTGLGSWWDHVQNRVGYQPTSDSKTETNLTEFLLERADRTGADFVTPLALVGQSQSINAVGVVAASENHAGVLNPYRVIVLDPPRQANSAVIDRLHADYGNLQEWAAGMAVYEIVPTGPATWQATMGMPKAIIYVARINADGTSCLFSARDGALVGCSTDKPGATVPPTGGGLSGLSDQDLARLLQQVSCEIAKRQGLPC